MCKTIAYTSQHRKYVSGLYVRIEYFSLPGFFEHFAKEKKVLLSSLNGSFQERPLTQEEIQLVDVDDIAADLEIAIEDIIGKRIFIYKSLSIQGLQGEFYISHNFVHLELSKIPEDLEWKDVLSLVAKILDLSKFKTELTIENFEIGIRHVLSVDINNIWDTLDHNAFMSIDDDPINSSYYDEYYIGDSIIGSKRFLRQIVCENVEFKYVASILTKTLVDSSALDALLGGIHLVEQETTKCFYKPSI